jgi:hypothetical protein
VAKPIDERGRRAIRAETRIGGQHAGKKKAGSGPASS